MLRPPDPAQPAPTGPGADDDAPWADEAWDMGLPGERAALEALRWNWGEAYDVGCDDGEWWYRRKDRKGGRETADTPDELRAAIVMDYTIFPRTLPALPGPAGSATGCPRASAAGEGRAVQWT